MCNINIIKNKTGKNKNLLGLLNTMTQNSFYYNNDGEGFIALTDTNQVFIGKSAEKIKYKNPNFKTIITHQRKSTSGYSFNNIHPHETEHFLLIHNGIVHNDNTIEKSDSRIYVEDLEKEYNKTGNVVQAIKRLSKKTMGSYSIVIFDKKTQDIYYYKEFMTNMFYVDTKDILIMSTSEANVAYACSVLKIDENLILPVKDDIIYKITNTLEQVDKLDQPEPMWWEKIIPYETLAELGNYTMMGKMTRL